MERNPQTMHYLFKDRDVQDGGVNRTILIELGGLIRSAREDAGISQSELANISNISQSDVSRIETGFGSNGPTLLTLARLASALDCRLVIELEPRRKGQKAVVDLQHRRAENPSSDVKIEMESHIDFQGERSW